MFEVYHFSEKEILSFILVLLRMSVFLVVWPVMGGSSVPRNTKVLLSIVITFVVFPLVGWQRLTEKDLSEFYIFLLMKEAFIGLTMGYVAKFFFYAIEVCGNMVSDAMGLSSAQILNPTMENQTSIIEQYYTVILTMLFLTFNGHHVFLSGIVHSYDMIPLSTHGLSLEVFKNSGEWLQAILTLGVKLAAPVFVSIFTMNIAMAIVGRAVPQMNVLVTSLGVNVLLGMFVMFISMPMINDQAQDFFNEMCLQFFALVRAFS